MVRYEFNADIRLRGKHTVWVYADNIEEAKRKAEQEVIGDLVSGYDIEALCVDDMTILGLDLVAETPDKRAALDEMNQFCMAEVVPHMIGSIWTPGSTRLVVPVCIKQG